MFAPLSTVLDFNAGLMMGIENMSQDWFDWGRIKSYHDQHLHSLKLSTNRTESKSGSVNNDYTKDTEDKKVKCSKNCVISQGICFRFQNDECDEGSSHDDGAGKDMFHVCGWCSFSGKGNQKPNNTTCKDKRNPLHKQQSSRPQQ